MTEVKLDDSERQQCEIWSRVMGYHRPVAQWNIGKRCEHKDRKFFTDQTGRWKVCTTP
jgi:hypothetical protein